MANRPWLNKRLSKTHREAISAGLKRFNAGKKWRKNCKKIDLTTLMGKNRVRVIEDENLENCGTYFINESKLEKEIERAKTSDKSGREMTATEVALTQFSENSGNLRLAIQCLETALGLLKCKL